MSEDTTPDVTDVKEDGDETTPEDSQTPPVRKTNADYARERVEKKEENNLKQTVAELMAKVEALSKEPEKKRTDLSDQSDVVADVVRKQEVADFISDNPQFSKYRSKIFEWSKTSTLPYLNLAYAIAGDDLLKEGAALAKNADQKAAESKTGGASKVLNTTASKNSVSNDVKEIGRLMGISEEDFSKFSNNK